MSNNNIKQNGAESCNIRKTSIGGQALIEGIMMKGPQKTAMAVRDPEGQIVIEEWENKTEKNSFLKKFSRLPIIRGVFGLIGSYALGIKCLLRSAEIAGLEDEEPADKKKKKADKTPSEENNAGTGVLDCPEKTDAEKLITPEEKTDEKKKSNDTALIAAASIIGMVLGVVLCIGLFVFLPAYLFDLVFNGLLGYTDDGTMSYIIAKRSFEGVIKIVLFVLYMYFVSFMKDIKRTFMYHGAEHMTIFCYEKGLELTVENVRKQSRFHPRCGTSFLIIMLIIGIFVGIFIPEFHVSEFKIINNLLLAAVKILLLPITVGLGYEVIKFAGRHDNAFVRIISAPGKWMQRISTKEPEDGMIECAIAALKKVIPDDGSDKW